MRSKPDDGGRVRLRKKIRPRRDAPALPSRPLADEGPLRIPADVPQGRKDRVERRDVLVATLEVRHEIYASAGAGSECL
jgi:hypothetical protein